MRPLLKTAVASLVSFGVAGWDAAAQPLGDALESCIKNATINITVKLDGKLDATQLVLFCEGADARRLYLSSEKVTKKETGENGDTRRFFGPSNKPEIAGCYKQGGVSDPSYLCHITINLAEQFIREYARQP
ncbi:hypothetical protein FHP25_13265 [Vineibacter terrae]|uniref:Uncharacterized protein n=1 Tax=Vineibacter terrae TaxID=2586908 RepID=A0A5C8PMF4_9HYPH|nr:hypothetical protein [Vineibacter terrae]TXL75619.1 hypothetical protein FHP25_13265 [Vineibacter terrae]